MTRTVTLSDSDLIYAACALDQRADGFAEMAKGSARIGRVEGATEMTRIALECRGRAARIRRALEAGGTRVEVGG